MNLNTNQLGALISGGLAFLFSLFGSYVTVSYDGDLPIGGISAGTSAWTSYATLGILLVLAATALVAVKAFMPDVLPANVPWHLVTLAAAGLGTVLLILRAITAGGSGVPGISVGPGWSAFLLWIACIALSVFSFLAFKESGEEIPDFNKGNDAPPAPPAA